MTYSRRTFLTTSAALLGLPAAGASMQPGRRDSNRPRDDGIRVRSGSHRAGYDPWLEIDPAAFEHNAEEVSRLCGGRPILGVVKNNAYGLGLTTVGPLLDRLDTICGLAVVKADQAIALRDAGVRKPILLMGLFREADGPDLVVRGIQLAPFSDGADERLARLGQQLGRRIDVHLYLDTGMSRLGMPHRRALPWIQSLANTKEVRIAGTFMTFTEEDDFDPEQLEHFLAVAQAARDRGINLGRLHAASSHGVFHRQNALLDMVRPGLVLYGAYPEGARQLQAATLRPAFRLRARVVRVERIARGDGVSYGRNYIAKKPTWIATLPVGHADGYPRRAVDGCMVHIRDRVYPVIGAVSASHTIVEVGEDRTVEVGDEATLVGWDHPAVHPNAVAERAEISVYDVLMHLSGGLPKRVIGA
ncbi:MAG: alanine racemase [Gemmatimonadales bacterium]|nr:alanine racemase [Gemmatimonadales bacterium]NIN13502.1 alanine racemase [Gemmatimonadales bacterium]NIN51494.1 alanine racemase [Gemmatimonadales bacterium]NIP08958.1 alanine racemase [Gemmatimonadales bacterium]NIR03636.1 alanine racemase [Gemmatimonadales bacterium]